MFIFYNDPGDPVVVSGILDHEGEKVFILLSITDNLFGAMAERPLSVHR